MTKKASIELGYPAGNLLYRKLKRNFPRIVRGEGCWLYDDAGKRYLDACGGAVVANLGHGVHEIGEAMAAQARRVGYINGTAFTHDPAEEMARELAEMAPKGLDKVLFMCNGGDAVEAALKLSRQYWVETGKPGKHKIIALNPSYHGNTLLAMSASARPHYRVFFKEWLVPVVTIPAPYTYRCSCRGKDKDCPTCTGEALETALRKEGPETVAAFIAEPVGGSSTGASVPRPGYFRRVREICDRHAVHFIADEVMSGAGRTGAWCAIEHSGVSPDLLTMGKGITGGYAPLSALIARKEIVDAVARGSGSPSHNQTFSQHPVCCAAGLAALRIIRSKKLVERCARMGRLMHDKLRPLAELPHVGDVRGLGLFAGVEFVKNKDTRVPFPRKLKFAEHLTEAAQGAGLVIWPNTGQADGTDGDLVMLAPPFTVSEGELDEMVELLKIALETTLKSLKS
ncbi:MAG: aspartate aminotransferase family protein [Elusimicrobiota bacterium]